MSLVKHSASIAMFSALLFGAGAARADTSCITAYEQTQTLRKDGKPIAARAQAAICAHDSCPALLNKDCNKWLAELDAATPTVLLDPRAASGASKPDARVKIDGALVTDRVEGKAVSLEPGSHTFVFEADGLAPVEQTLVIREGEKGRKITATLVPLAEGQRAAVDRPIPFGVWIFGGASVIALATSVIFAVDGLGKKSDLDQCKPRCPSSDIDSMSTSFTFADVALGAGVMAGAAALYLFLTRPSVEVTSPPPGTSPAASARARIVPIAAPLPGGAAFGLTTRF